MSYGNYSLLVQMRDSVSVMAAPFETELERDEMCQREGSRLVITPNGLKYLKARKDPPPFPKLGRKEGQEEVLFSDGDGI